MPTTKVSKVGNILKDIEEIMLAKLGNEPLFNEPTLEELRSLAQKGELHTVAELQATLARNIGMQEQ